MNEDFYHMGELMNENDPVEGNNDDEESKKGMLAGGAAAAGGAASLAKGALGKAKDAAAAAKDAAASAAGGVTDAAAGAKDAAGGVTGAVSGAAAGAKDAAGGVTGAVSGAAAGAKDAAGGVTGAVSGAAGGAKDAAASAAGGVTDAAAGAKDAAGGVTGAVSGVSGGVVAGGAAASAAAAGAVGGAKDAAAGAADGVRGAVSGAAGGTQDAAAGVVASGAVASAAVGGVGGTGNVGGSGGSGGSGGGAGGGGGDDDDDKLIPVAPVSGDNQIVILGLLVAAFMLFGGGLLAFFGFGDDDAVSEVVALEDVEDLEALAEENPQCGAVLQALADNEDLDEESFEDVTCTSSEDGQITLSGEVESDSVRSSVLATAAGVIVAGNELIVDGEEVTVPEVEVEEVAAPETTVAPAPETTTTEAPETTTTEAPETTTTEAPAPEAFTMWDALNGSGEAVQFAVIGGALGLQDDLETLELEDGTPVMRTLFAPSDAALQNLGPEAIGALSSDPEGAAALVGYHFLDETLTAEDLVALDGDSVQTRTQLPLNITVVDGEVILNGTSRVVSSDFTADNGIVHIIDTVLQPPTLNQVLDLENIEFDPAQATITAAGQATLQRAVDFFTANPTVNATIEGHTDSDGSDALNDELSQARADSVRQFLIDAGLDGERFTAVGFGENQLILVDGVEDKEASRRIEFVVQ